MTERRPQTFSELRRRALMQKRFDGGFREDNDIDDERTELTMAPEVIFASIPGPAGAARIRKARREQAERQAQLEAAYGRGVQDTLRSLGVQAVAEGLED